MVNYISTRGSAPTLSFEDTLIAGLASDGGLYVPDEYPSFDRDTIASWQSLSYQELAFEVMSPFVGDAITAEDFKRLIGEAYSTFRHPAIAPMVQLGQNEWVLELFHGPTLAFKDFALQLLGRLLEYTLTKRNQHVAVLGATSGDTGSAAIEGCRSCSHIEMFILHPHGKVSDVQRKQMTTVISDNIHNIALEGNFDDCQNIVKQLFQEQDSFLNGKSQLVAVNSINWARIMAQIVYYFYAALHLGAPHRQVSFSVPTGNFGDIFAGYVAQKMGLPIKQLVIATNQNDILHRCLSNNDYSKNTLAHTIAPSMDITISSNFERLLFDLYENNANAIAELMQGFNQTGGLSIDPLRLEKARTLFTSHAVDESTICNTIKKVYEESQYLLDPHTAIGVNAARAFQDGHDVPMVTLATAHPAKFPGAIAKSGLDIVPPLPLHLKDLFEREEKLDVMDNNPEKVKDAIAKALGI